LDCCTNQNIIIDKLMVEDTFSFWSAYHLWIDFFFTEAKRIRTKSVDDKHLDTALYIATSTFTPNTGKHIVNCHIHFVSIIFLHIIKTFMFSVDFEYIWRVIFSY
jgi:hypothetical protein